VHPTRVDDRGILNNAKELIPQKDCLTKSRMKILACTALLLWFVRDLRRLSRQILMNYIESKIINEGDALINKMAEVLVKVGELSERG
jgi:hypothetical protein